jgi:hypothetical protein
MSQVGGQIRQQEKQQQGNIFSLGSDNKGEEVNNVKPKRKLKNTRKRKDKWKGKKHNMVITTNLFSYSLKHDSNLKQILCTFSYKSLDRKAQYNFQILVSEDYYNSLQLQLYNKFLLVR